jgi:hypothetical protein
LVILAENNRIQLVWVLGHVGIDGNERVDELPRQDSSHPLIGPEPVLDISPKVVRVGIKGWTSGKHEEHWQSTHGHRQANGFLRKTSATRAGKLLNLSRSQVRLLTGLLT